MKTAIHSRPIEHAPGVPACPCRTRARASRLAFPLALLVALPLALPLTGCGGDGPSLVAPSAAQAAPAPQAVAADPWTVPPDIPRPALRYTRFETFTRADGLPSDRVTCVLAEPGALVVGTEAGVAIRRDGAFTVLGTAEGLSHPFVTAVARQAETGDLWIATLSGLNRLSGGVLRTFTQQDSGLMNDVVYHVLADGPLVWAATAAGVSVLDTRAGTWALWNQRNSIMHEPWCYAVARGPGRTWVGVWGGGVIEREDVTGAWREYRDPDGEMEVDLFRDDGPIHDVTSFVAYDAGRLWQSTYFGLSGFDGRRWQSWTAKDTGLPGDFVHHVHARGHAAWISTDQGFAVFDGRTCVSYRGDGEGGCAVTVWVDGREVERSRLETAPGDDHVLWAQGGDRDVWLATARGLSHGVADPE